MPRKKLAVFFSWTLCCSDPNLQGNSKNSRDRPEAVSSPCRSTGGVTDVFLISDTPVSSSRIAPCWQPEGGLLFPIQETTRIWARMRCFWILPRAFLGRSWRIRTSRGRL
jgi:hypothetical protein